MHTPLSVCMRETGRGREISLATHRTKERERARAREREREREKERERARASERARERDLPGLINEVIGTSPRVLKQKFLILRPLGERDQGGGGWEGGGGREIERVWYILIIVMHTDADTHTNTHTHTHVSARAHTHTNNTQSLNDRPRDRRTYHRRQWRRKCTPPSGPWEKSTRRALVRVKESVNKV